MSGIILDHKGRPIEPENTKTTLVPRRRFFDIAEDSRFNTAAINTPIHINDAVYWTLRGQIGVSRDQARNNPYYKRHIRQYQKYVVGPGGMQFQNEATGRQGEPNIRVNELIERQWKLWGMARNFSVDGKTSRRATDKLFVKSILQDGEFILWKRRGRGRFGMQIQVLDPWRLDIHKNEISAETGNRIVMGVEIDDDLAPVAYWFRDLPQSITFGVSRFYSGAQRWIRLPASEILHAFIREDPEQLRGFPPNQSALTNLRELKKWQESGVISMALNANQQGIIRGGEPPEPEGDRDPADAIAQDLAQSEPGGWWRIPEEWEIEQPEGKFPNSDMETGNRAILQGSTAGLDLAYPLVGMDLAGVNQSTMRAFGRDDYETFLDFFAMMVDTYARPLYEEWLAIQLLAGNLSGLGPESFENVNRPEFKPKPYQSPEPLKDAQTDRQYYDMNAMSLTEIAAKRGRQIEDVLAEKARENEMMETLGLSQAEAVAAATQPSTTSDDNEEDEGSEEPQPQRSGRRKNIYRLRPRRQR